MTSLQGAYTALVTPFTADGESVDHERLVEDTGANLLVLNTRDEDQLAMHGLAHPLAVGLRRIPLLML